jgi:acyl-CoA synthetase (AMP-forming)/AMP-acid ligase II
VRLPLPRWEWISAIGTHRITGRDQALALGALLDRRLSVPAVVGLPDDKWGEKVAAVIITKPGVDPADITEKDIMECCRQKLAGYKRPKEVIFISQEEMPRTPTGKILHRILKERFRLKKG